MRKVLTVLVLLLSLSLSSFLQADPYVIIILGPPGAGKGTMSHKLNELTGLTSISLKELLSEQAKKEGEMNKKVKAFMSMGQRVPDDITLEVLRQRIDQSDCQAGFILQGFPRTKKQAEMLTKTFPNKKQLFFVNMVTQDQTVMDRLQGRRTCEQCNKRYHIVWTPPKKEAQCDDCGGKLITSSKNQASAAEERLKIYKAQYEPIKAYLQPKYQWVDVTNESTEDCFATLIDKMKNHELLQVNQ